MLPPEIFRSSEIDSDPAWANLGGKNHIFISFSMTSCSLQKLLADLGVNVILVTTLAKHCSYIYCFKIGTLNSPRGGGGHLPPLKETLQCNVYPMVCPFH